MSGVQKTEHKFVHKKERFLIFLKEEGNAKCRCEPVQCILQVSMEAALTESWIQASGDDLDPFGVTS